MLKYFSAANLPIWHCVKCVYALVSSFLLFPAVCITSHVHRSVNQNVTGFVSVACAQLDMRRLTWIQLLRELSGRPCELETASAASGVNAARSPTVFRPADRSRSARFGPTPSSALTSREYTAARALPSDPAHPPRRARPPRPPRPLRPPRPPCPRRAAAAARAASTSIPLSSAARSPSPRAPPRRRSAACAAHARRR